MHPTIFQVFQEICKTHPVHGSVLEIGATPDESTLLNLPALNGVTEKIGINMEGASRFKDFTILQANANDLTRFPDQRFDAVLCNATLEHDRFFWKTLAEIRRVVRVGGLVVIGAPGYVQLPIESKIRRFFYQLARLTRRTDGWFVQHSTLTFAVHNFPGDYYRFSEQAFREVFFEGMTEIVMRTIMVPPRIIGVGFRAKPA